MRLFSCLWRIWTACRRRLPTTWRVLEGCRSGSCTGADVLEIGEQVPRVLPRLPAVMEVLL